MTAGLESLLASREMVIVCGSGGTGKTTVAAALGVSAAARLGGRTLVITVDPARRLASALGLQAVGNAETRVDPALFAAAGASARGELWVTMLDTKAGWDELIRRHAPDATLRDQVLANPLYENITSRFVHSHDYIAMERLHELHASGRYDLVIVDTPPSRNALDLLDAPGRMREFFGSRLLRWLTVPYRSRLFTIASKPFYQVADRVLGSHFLHDIADFFVLFQAMEHGFVARAKEVERLLVDPRTSLLVVSTLEAAPVQEARFLVDELRRRRMDLGGIVLNRVLPEELRDPRASIAATALARAVAVDADLDRLAAAVDGDASQVRAVVEEIAERFHDVAVVASREAERASLLSSLAPVVVSAPPMRSDVNDVALLLELGRHLV